MIDIDVWHFNHIMLGGDQLTSARVRGTHRARCNSDSARNRLEGIIPVIEDWHTKMTVMKVCIANKDAALNNSVCACAWCPVDCTEMMLQSIHAGSVDQALQNIIITGWGLNVSIEEPYQQAKCSC